MKKNTTNTNSNHSLVFQAWKNTKEAIPFVLKGSFDKHYGRDAQGSRLWRAPRPLTQGQLEKILFRDIKSWTEAGTFPNGKVLEASLPLQLEAELSAAPLEALPPDTRCRVDQLGPHPTLSAVGTAVPTRTITCIVELDAGLDEDLEDFPQLAGKSIIATWFPGPSTPPSRPEGCAVGDTLTAKEAIDKGWKTVVFRKE